MRSLQLTPALLLSATTLAGTFAVHAAHTGSWLPESFGTFIGYALVAFFGVALLALPALSFFPHAERRLLGHVRRNSSGEPWNSRDLILRAIVFLLVTLLVILVLTQMRSPSTWY